MKINYECITKFITKNIIRNVSGVYHCRSFLQCEFIFAFFSAGRNLRLNNNNNNNNIVDVIKYKDNNSNILYFYLTTTILEKNINYYCYY